MSDAARDFWLAWHMSAAAGAPQAEADEASSRAARLFRNSRSADLVPVRVRDTVLAVWPDAVLGVEIWKEEDDNVTRASIVADVSVPPGYDRVSALSRYYDNQGLDVVYEATFGCGALDVRFTTRQGQ